MMDDAVVLKPHKEKALLHRHHWIFSGAVAHFPRFSNGDLLPVISHDGKPLGNAYFNRKSGIVGRMVSFDTTPPLESIANAMSQAIKYRNQLFVGQSTDAYRLINGEGDSLPGLIVDHYAGRLVLQIGTLGMEMLKPFIVKWLKDNLQPISIYEKSMLSTRKEEGLSDAIGVLDGDPPGIVQIVENGLKFNVNIVSGQKTGFFLDQREMRQLIKSHARGKRVLNCFAYTGGFSAYALAGEARQVTSVEISPVAIKQARENVALNGFVDEKATFIQADVFQFLRQDTLDYDLVILDPPAFAKKKKDQIAACRGYKEINRLTMQKMPAGSMLLTCSCSYHIDEALFQKVLFQAAVEASRNVRIMSRHHLAADHPVNLCHPEGDYLKSFLLFIE